jgi:hypothetical protein
VQEGIGFRVRDEGYWIDALLLGIRGVVEPREIFLEQGKYAVEILRRFRMMDCKSMTTPMTTNLNMLGASDSDLVDPTMYRKLIGSLMYLVNTRPNICFVVNTLSQFMVESRQVHWVATKHVLRYLRGTVGFGLRYVRGDGVRLHGYSDSDWAGSAVERKSTSGGCFNLGSTMVSWYNRKQTLWHSVQQRQSIWQLVWKVVRLFGFTSFLQGYLVRSWSLL